MGITKNLMVYLGRFSPLHLGHQKIINTLIKEFGLKNIIIMAGSSNTTNDKTPFSIEERVGFIKSVYPDIKIIPIPDYHDDTKWLNHIKKLEYKLNAKFRFVGGSKEDLAVLERMFDTKVLIDRTKKVNYLSGTLVRETLKNKNFRSLSKMIDPKVYLALTSTSNIPNTLLSGSKK